MAYKLYGITDKLQVYPPMGIVKDDSAVLIWRLKDCEPETHLTLYAKPIEKDCANVKKEFEDLTDVWSTTIKINQKVFEPKPLLTAEPQTIKFKNDENSVEVKITNTTENRIAVLFFTIVISVSDNSYCGIPVLLNM